MRIFIRMQDGTTFPLEVESSDTIQQVKQKIHDQRGIPPQWQTLVFGGVVLNDGPTLADYQVGWDDTLDLQVLAAAMAPVAVPTLSPAGLVCTGALIGLGALLERRRKLAGGEH